MYHMCEEFYYFTPIYFKNIYFSLGTQNSSTQALKDKMSPLKPIKTAIFNPSAIKL